MTRAMPPKAVKKARPADSGVSSDIRLIAGLGNPGAGYAQTRHNAGFWFADRLAAVFGGQFRSESRYHGEVAQLDIAGNRLWVIKPDTFMNRSGLAVHALAAFYKLAPQQVLVAHDELDLPAGTVRLKRGGGHGGHNGLRDLHRCLGPDYARLRIGIGHPGHKDMVLDYVLGKPIAADARAIEDAIEDSVAAMRVLYDGGWDRATQGLHRRGA